MVQHAQDFVQTFLSFLEPGHRVLDLGSGSGDFSHLFADRGAVVTAVDANAEASDTASVTVLRMTVEDFIMRRAANAYHLVFMRNIAQFLEKHWVFETLFPWLDAHVAQDGLVGIETMHHDPDPPFDRPLRSLYTVQELAQHLSGWQEVLAQEHDHNEPDLRGTIRHFFLTDYIARKNRAGGKRNRRGLIPLVDNSS